MSSLHIDDVKGYFSCLKDKYSFNFDLKTEQCEIIFHVLYGHHTFGMLPTGFGKSMTYILVPLIQQMITGKPCTALVVSPLKALMLDQVLTLRSKGLKTCAIMTSITDEEVQDIQAGRVDVVFCSPESITQKYWMRIMKEGKLRDQLSVLVFDEAHCISEWGLDFRPDYRSVSDLVSILDHIPTLLLTATATKAIQRDLYSLLALPASTKVVARIPDRPNIYLHIEQAVERLESLQWTIDHLSRYGIKSKKILVYCRTLRSCQTLYMWCMENLGDKAFLSSEHLVKDRLVDMFHSKADQETVSRIMNDFPKEESVIRLLFSTVAFGLGVQIDSIDIVVHYGIESTTLSYWQEIGRCARDGRPGLAITYAFKRSVNDCDDANMKEVATSTNCIRSLLLRIFILQGSDSINFQHSECDMKCEFWCKCSYCLCCSNCHKKCKCPSKVRYVLERV